ncbi:MAG: sigma-70 family RNA polymerase sigma factor [Xanthobacteraceae bacterium]|nr:sigma-70 family RNA polymerase sigma factor [Xanthobacteraceae bacterium]
MPPSRWHLPPNRYVTKSCGRAYLRGEFVRSPERELEWTTLMIAAVDGNAGAYRRLLELLTPVIRATAMRACRRFSAPLSEVEDAVQETLIAIHLKRHTWRKEDPLGPWVNAIVRNKLIDALRRRTRRAEIEIDGLSQELPAETAEEPCASQDIERALALLPERDRAIVRTVSLEGHSMRDAAMRLGMNEGAVRVALHRALKKLAAGMRKEQE